MNKSKTIIMGKNIDDLIKYCHKSNFKFQINLRGIKVCDLLNNNMKSNCPYNIGEFVYTKHQDFYVCKAYKNENN